MLDIPVPDEPNVTDAAAVTRAHVPAHPVVVELVVVGTGAEGRPACPGRRSREQFVADGIVQRDRVVMDVHVQVKAVRQLQIRDAAGLAGARIRVGRGPRQIPVGRFTLADVDAARQRADIVVHPVVGDFQVMRPGVREDTAAALGAVGDGQTIDARRVALEVARVRVGTRRKAIVGRQNHGAGRESGFRAASVIARGAEGIHALGQDRDSSSFVRSHQGRLLQQLGQVAVGGGVPANDALQR